MVRWLGMLVWVMGALSAFGQRGWQYCPEHKLSPDPAKWTWMDRDCKERTRADLDAILTNHSRWFAKYTKAVGNLHHSGEVPGVVMKDPLRADLSGADLSGANLTGENLVSVDLVGSKLSNANLKGADLLGSDLTGATLPDADLTYADAELADLTDAMMDGVKAAGAQFDGAQLSRAALISTDLTEGIFDGADLTGAHLEESNLTDARFVSADLSEVKLGAAFLEQTDFTNADLSGADLSAHLPYEGAYCEQCVLKGTDMSNVNLAGTSLLEADFEPRAIPPANSVADANDLKTLLWNNEMPEEHPHRSLLQRIERFFDFERDKVSGNRKPMLDLRKELHDAGYHDAYVQVNLAIHRMDESWWETVVFDWTCEWGATWQRPLQEVMAVGLLCSVVYWWLLRFTRRNKLYVVGKRGKREQRLLVGHRGAAPGWFAGERWWRLIESPWRRMRWEMRLYWTAALFSLMSVLNLGVQGFDLGRWVRLMHNRDFDLQARGTIRTIAGVQSVVSFALLALAALSYFGHPFE